jgi:histone acetyltransferase
MKAAYPAANQQNRLNDSQLALKIARHSRCSVCNTCVGLRPATNVDVVLDELPTESSLGDLGQYGSDDEDAAVPYLQTCACGHDVLQHGADESDIGPAEFSRRSRVAIRLDELLQASVLQYYSVSQLIEQLFPCRCARPQMTANSVLNIHNQDVAKLLDFGYIDEDIASLRRQMKLHVSLVSPTLHPTSSPGLNYTYPVYDVVLTFL